MVYVANEIPLGPAAPLVPQDNVRSELLHFFAEAINRIAPVDFLAQALIVDPAALLIPADSNDAPSTILMPIIKEFLVEDDLMQTPNFW